MTPVSSAAIIIALVTAAAFTTTSIIRGDGAVFVSLTQGGRDGR